MKWPWDFLLLILNLMEAICEPFYGCYLAPQATFLDSLLLVTNMAFPQKKPFFIYLCLPTSSSLLPEIPCHIWDSSNQSKWLPSTSMSQPRSWVLSRHCRANLRQSRCSAIELPTTSLGTGWWYDRHTWVWEVAGHGHTWNHSSDTYLTNTY